MPKWFGRAWGAPLCIPENHVATPKGRCYICERVIHPGHAGVLIPNGGPPEDERAEVGIHIRCYIEGLLTNRV